MLSEREWVHRAVHSSFLLFFRSVDMDLVQDLPFGGKVWASWQPQQRRHLHRCHMVPSGCPSPSLPVGLVTVQPRYADTSIFSPSNDGPSNVKRLRSVPSFITRIVGDRWHASLSTIFPPPRLVAPTCRSARPFLRLQTARLRGVRRSRVLALLSGEKSIYCWRPWSESVIMTASARGSITSSGSGQVWVTPVHLQHLSRADAPAQCSGCCKMAGVWTSPSVE